MSLVAHGTANLVPFRSGNPANSQKFSPNFQKKKRKNVLQESELTRDDHVGIPDGFHFVDVCNI